VPKKQPKRGRLWLNDGSCVRLRTKDKDHVWSYINHKRVERIWKQEGLKVPKKQPKRGRLWLNSRAMMCLSVSLG